MPIDLKRGIVRILASDGATTSGTGFILSEKGVIVTCSHVIQAEKLQVRGYPRPERVQIVFRANGEKATARLLPQAWRASDADDVAFLQLEEPLPQGAEPLPLGGSDGAAGHPFQTFGFPDQSPEEGLYGEGRLIDQTSILGMKVWQVQSSEITPGFSGGPVLDEHARRVVGMVTSIAAPDRFGRLSETAFVTPAETLFSIYPEIGASDVRPYMGLAAFTEKDAEFFFGRKKLVEGLEHALHARPRFLLVMGPSGSGKSSVVQAGLIPRLRQGSVPGSDRWGIIVARPADRPFESLERAGLRGAYAGLTDSVRGWMERNPGQEKLFLILDQFEEYLVTCPTDLRRRLWAGLKDLLDSEIDVTVLAVMRDDFYSRFADDAPPSVLAWTQRGFFQVGSLLEKEELQEIIQQPARRVGLHLEEGLVDVIINDVLDSSREGGGKAGRSTVLPLLEFALTQLWERREQGQLTHQAYQAIGKVTGSLTLWADQVCRALEKEGLGPTARAVFTDLVNLGDESHRLPDSRRQRRLADLVHDGMDQKEMEAVRRVVQRLADARLVTTTLDKGEESVQIIHDSLIREWTRLQRWLKKDRAFLSWQRELERDAREWRDTGEASGRDEGRLLRGRRLEEAERWQSERGSDLGEAEREFLQAGLDLKERERETEERARVEKERSRRRIIQGVVIFSIFSLALAGVTYDKMLEANDRKEEALARSLAAQSEQLRSVTGSLTDGVLLAVESLRHKETLVGEIALRRSLALLPRCEAQFMHNRVIIRSAALSPDCRRLATVCSDDIVRLWDVNSGRLLYEIKHNDSVNDAVFGPNGHILATACDDRIARLWDVLSGKLLHSLEHNKSVRKVAFNPYSLELATASTDHTARIWDVESGKELHRLNHEDDVRALAFSPDGRNLATSDDDKKTRLWDAETGEELKKLELDDDVRDIAFSPDGKTLATDDNYRTARLFDAETGKELKKLEHEDEITDIAFSPDGKMLATASYDQTARLWNVESGNMLQELKHDIEVNALAFSPDGRKLATACNDQAARLWDIKTGKVLQRMEHNRSEIFMVAFSSDGRKMVTANYYPSVCLWDIGNEKDLQRLEHDDSVSSAIFSPSGQLLATVSLDKTVRLWNVKTRKEVRRFKLNDSAGELTFSPDGSKLVAVCRDRIDPWECMVHLWDAETGEELEKLRHDGWINELAFSPDSNKLATACEDDMVHLWDISTRNETKNLSHDDSVDMVKFSPDGLRLASACKYGKKVELWDVKTGVKLLELEHEGVDSINSLVFSPDGRKIATTAYSLSLDKCFTRLWDVESGREVYRLKNDYDVNAMEFSPDGHKLATASDDRAVHLWDVKTGDELKKLEHDHSIDKMAFSPDGRNLATASSSDEQMAHLWDTETGKELQRLEHDGLVRSVAFSPDGSMLATASEDGTARIWMLNIDKVIEDACHKIDRNMTSEEWSRFIDKQDCLTCHANGSFNHSSIWPWGRRECQPCGGNLG